uniref:NAC domain protein n=1 Tax=Rhizophora mucronata TaxID=61149 RepID=A0A2P2LTY2_RHIMU
MDDQFFICGMEPESRRQFRLLVGAGRGVGAFHWGCKCNIQYLSLVL